jgi:predicted  nucleic acid-binding Zn-ribbon protein
VNREEIGKKININLAIQGEVESARALVKQLTDEKKDTDKIVSAGVEAKKKSDSLAGEIKVAKANLESLESELVKSDAELESAGAKVPRLINEPKDVPSHIRM